MKPIVVFELNTRTQARKTHAFSAAPIALGRGAQADVRLDAEHVSLLHGSLSEERGRLVYLDHESSNGTLVDGKQVGSCVEIGSNSVIRIGIFALKVSRELPPGVVAKKPTSAPRDASMGVAAPRTETLSKSALNVLVRDGAPESVSPPPPAVERIEPPPVSAELVARPTAAAPVPLPSIPSVEIDRLAMLPQVSAGLTKTMLHSDLFPGDGAGAVAVDPIERRPKPLEQRASPVSRRAPVPEGTPFPGRHFAWFETGERLDAATAELEPLGGGAWSTPRFYRLATVIVVGVMVGFGMAFVLCHV